MGRSRSPPLGIQREANHGEQQEERKKDALAYGSCHPESGRPTGCQRIRPVCQGQFKTSFQILHGRFSSAIRDFQGNDTQQSQENDTLKEPTEVSCVVKRGKAVRDLEETHDAMLRRFLPLFSVGVGRNGAMKRKRTGGPATAIPDECVLR